VSDDIDDALEQAVQHAMAIAAQVGRELARAWQNHMETSARLNERDAAAVSAAFNAERSAAAAGLIPVHTAEWWDEAQLRDIVNAYEISTAWAPHDPRAAGAEQVLRHTAAERYGFDPERLAEEGHLLTEHLLNTEPGRLAQAQQWARETGWEGPPSFYPEAQKVRALLRASELDIERAARSLEAAAAAELRAGEAASEAERQHGSAAGTDKDHAAYLEREGDRDPQLELDEAIERAHAWALANDPDYAVATADEQQQMALDIAERWQESGPPADVEQAAVAARRAGEQHDVEGMAAARSAGVAYDRAEQLEREAARMRAAGAPERAIAAKQFGEAQQKFPVAHAAAGDGKALGKVKAEDLKKSQRRGKQMSQSR
jgi:hypothetical protein